jgi:hypothetical protein
VNGSDKHSSLLWIRTITAIRSFIAQAPGLLKKFFFNERGSLLAKLIVDKKKFDPIKWRVFLNSPTILKYIVYWSTILTWPNLNICSSYLLKLIYPILIDAAKIVSFLNEIKVNLQETNSTIKFKGFLCISVEARIVKGSSTPIAVIIGLQRH